MQRSKWRSANLVDVAAKKRWALNGGPFGSKLSRKHYTESGVPVIRGSNLPFDSRFSFADFVYVSEEKADELIANNAHPGDLIFTQRGTIGQVGLIPMDSPFPRFVISQSQMKLTVDTEQADAEFLYYFFTAAETVQKILNLTLSSGVPHINLEILRKFETPVPPLRTQQRIAAILLAYDELIENSQKRIKILESMAGALYREWFVHFRYPGHESVPLVPSSLGDIPQGWEVTTLGRLVNLRKGKNITKTTVRDGIVPVIAGGLEPAYFHDVANTRGPVITISASGANAGFVNLHYGDVWASDCSYIDSAATAQNFYYYLWLDHRRALVTHLQRGSAQPHVYTKDLEDLEAIDIPEELLSTFSSRVGPMFDLLKLLGTRINNLRASRDLLLPRLLCGQIDVGIAA